MKLSVIISNRNDVEMLAVTVRSVLEEFKALASDAEIIICDNSDNHVYPNVITAIPEDYQKSGLVRVIRQDFPCLFSARDKAIEEAKGMYVLMLDSHMLCGRDMIADLVSFMDRHWNDPKVGFAHAPINWARQSDTKARHDRDLSENELGPWGLQYDKERKITWKGMPWICRRSWYRDILKGYGALSSNRMGWGGGDMHIGTKPWLLGFENWAVPTSPGIHIGPFKGSNSKYRVYHKSGTTPSCVGFLTSAYVLGDEPLMKKIEPVLNQRFKQLDTKQWWKRAKQFGEDERRELRVKQVMSYAEFIETKPWMN